MSGRLRLEHRPRFRPIRRARFGRLAKAGFFILGIPKGSFCSIDVTARCNLRCRHCYFLEQGYDKAQELTEDQWEARFAELQRQVWPRPYVAFQASWVGGEPLLRKPVIERCRRFFPYNIVVTNGTIPLPSWPDVHFFVSVDGTRETHEAIRGAGTYDKIRANADRTDLNVMATYCINRENRHCIEEFIVEWDRTSIRHVTFEFHTPIHGLDDDEALALSPEERDQTLELLLALKRIYGHFILPPARSYRLMNSRVCEDVTKRCIYPEAAVVLGPDGRSKSPCVLGPKADCDRCGCIIPFVTEAQVNRREMLRDLWQDLGDRFRPRPAGCN